MPRIEPLPYQELSLAAREMIERGQEEGRISTTVPLQILGHNPELLLKFLRRYEEDWHSGMLEPRLQELVRIRSAQINQCEPCSVSRKEPGLIEEDELSCLTSGDDLLLAPRERLAVRFTEKLSNDYLSIDDQDFRNLAEEFSAAEIVELGHIAAHYIGRHRWNHALGLLDDRHEPVVAYEAAAIGGVAAMDEVRNGAS